MKIKTDTDKKLELFRSRLKELRSDNKLQDIAQDIGISRASLGYYENGDRKPDIEVLIKLATYYNVSSDYLLGLTDIKSPDINNRAISEQLGLSDNSINTIAKYYQNAIRQPEDGLDDAPAISSLLIDTINKLFEADCKILSNIMYYLYPNFDYYYEDYNINSEDEYSHISELGLFDKRLGIAYYESDSYFKQVFLLKIQNELTQLRERIQQNLPKRITPIAQSDTFDDIDEE